MTRVTVQCTALVKHEVLMTILDINLCKHALMVNSVWYITCNVS